MRIALYSKLAGLISALCYLQKGFLQKSKEFTDVVKIGRTQLQDAVPITLGMEFSAYATTLEEDINRLNEARELLLEVNIGATAVGTGICSPSGYFPALVFALAAGGAGAEERKLLVVCSLFPQYDFVRQVAGDRAEVQMLLSSGVESHTFEPRPSDVKTRDRTATSGPHFVNSCLALRARRGRRPFRGTPDPRAGTCTEGA